VTSGSRVDARRANATGKKGGKKVFFDVLYDAGKEAYGRSSLGSRKRDHPIPSAEQEPRTTSHKKRKRRLLSEKGAGGRLERIGKEKEGREGGPFLLNYLAEKKKSRPRGRYLLHFYRKKKKRDELY